MSHDCVKELNALLAPSNTMLAVAISFGEPSRELIMLATQKADDKIRRKPSLFFASFCPMCGVDLRRAPPQTGAAK